MLPHENVMVGESSQTEEDKYHNYFMSSLYEVQYRVSFIRTENRTGCCFTDRFSPTK